MNQKAVLKKYNFRILQYLLLFCFGKFAQEFRTNEELEKLGKEHSPIFCGTASII